MDEATLAALEHENMIETMTTAAAATAAGIVRRFDGVVLFATGLPVPLFNQVVIERGAATPDAIAEAVATMRDRSETFVVNLRRGTDDRFVPVMAELGLALPAEATPMPGMAVHPIGSTPDQGPADLDIRLVEDQAGMEDHLRTAAAGFGMPEALLRAFVSADLWRQDGRAVYVGSVDGQPVTTGLGVRTGRTIGVYNIATIEGARRRGYGATMTERVATDGAAAGADVAILQSSEMGRRVYEGLGYRTVVEYEGWSDPPENGPLSA
jgi:GNAT superfamily N-acetyltransferase